MPVATISSFGIGDLSVPREDYLKHWSPEADSDFLDIVRRHLRAGGTFVDVGANIGFLSVLAAKLQPEAEIIAIEASPEMADLVRENFRNHGLDRAEVYNLAAGASTGDTHFVEGGPFGHIVIEEGASASANAIRVPMKPLDSIVAERRVDIIKIDVEGFEKDVIDGCGEIDRRSKPGYYIEFNIWTLMMYRRINPPDFF